LRWILPILAPLQVFDLNALNSSNQAVVESFVTAFASAKLNETIDFCTANPTAPDANPVKFRNREYWR
jgi:hypothetical protein